MGGAEDEVEKLSPGGVRSERASGGLTTGDWVRRIQRGEDRERGFRVLHDRHHGRVVARLRSQGARESDLDDLVQASFVRAIESIEQLRDVDYFAGWLTSIASNLLREHHRRGATDKRRSLQVPLDDDSPGASTADDGPEDAVLRDERASRLAAAVDALPESMRRCIVLHYYQGLTAGQVGAVLRISPEAARARLTRARSRLRAHLESDPEFTR